MASLPLRCIPTSQAITRAARSHRISQCVALLLLLSACACRPTTPPQTEGDRVGSAVSSPELEPSDVVVETVQRVEDIDHPERPTLRLIHREGDPRGAVAVSLFPPGGSRDVALMAGMLEARMLAAGYHGMALNLHSLGLLAAIEVSSGQQAIDFFDAVRQALLQPVGKNDPSLPRARDLLTPLVARAGSPSAVDSCLGVLGAEGVPGIRGSQKKAPSSLSSSELERVRSRSVTASRIGLAALGEPSLLRAAAKGHSGEWPTGAPVDDSWTSPSELNVLPGSPRLELRVAVRVQSQEAALAAARALKSEEHPLFSRMTAIAPQLKPEPARVTLRPAGACVATTWRLAQGEKRPSLQLLSAAALVARKEMLQSLQDAQTANESTLALLAPENALEAAGLAAWTAVRSPGARGTNTALVELRGGPQLTRSQKKFRKLAQETLLAWEERGVPLSSRVEGGQAEAWLLLATPCGTANERSEEAGLRALTVASLARSLSGTMHVKLEPWISSSAVGLLAHAPPLRGETPEHHASRVARAAAQAFAGPRLDGRQVAAARADHLERIDHNPGRSLLIRVLSGGVPSWLSPWGLEREVATLSTADVERCREELLREPLRAAFIANSSEIQEEAAKEALSDWLAPHRSGITSCARRTPEPGQGGNYHLQTVDEAVSPSAAVGVYAPASRAIGKALEYLFNRPGGYLERALLEPRLSASARATWLGDEVVGGLIIELRAEEHQLDRAVDQARAVLHELSEGAISTEDVARARQEKRLRDRRQARTPRGRVVELWHDAEEVSLTRTRFLAVASQFAPPHHRVVRVSVRD